MTTVRLKTQTQEIVESRLYADSRNMVREREGRTTEAKRTVAMTAIRTLETDSGNVAAIMPMILELYLRRDTVDIVNESIEKHSNECGVKKVFGRMSIAIFGAGGGAGLLGALIQWLVSKGG